MRLAVMLLVAVAVASVAGTILKQNQPHPDYLIEFGPFWYEVYRTLGLFDVYSSIWFMSLLAFMMGSISVCLVRHTPVILSQLRDRGERLSERAIKRRSNCQEFVMPGSPEQTHTQLRAVLATEGWRPRGEDQHRISAVKGRLNRLSYLFIHSAILIICAGGLLDSTAGLKLRVLMGELEIETRDLPFTEVPARSRLSNDNRSFRSSVLIPEGKASNFSFINIGNGYLLQSLPFTVQLVDFRVRYYSSGQPKSFESDLLIQDAAGLSETHTIRVNHPLKYRGYTIYQSSFGDGGSSLELSAHPLLPAPPSDTGPQPIAGISDGHTLGAPGTPLPLSGTVGENLAVVTVGGVQQLEITEFRRFNIFEGNETEKEFRDHGPSMNYKLRNEDGTALEFQNYMLPVQVDEHYYILSGVRAAIDEEFRFLHLPVDDDFSLNSFFRFHAALHDDALLTDIATELSANSSPESQALWAEEGVDLTDAIVRFLVAFREGGFHSINNFVANNQLAGAQREGTMEVYSGLLWTLMATIYRRTFAQTEEPDERFFQDAVVALSALPDYGAPMLITIRDFEQREASGLQINRAPGARWVYLGFLLLVSGVFLMFYVPHQRLFVLLKEESAGTRIVIAGERTRHHKRAFVAEFAALCARIREKRGD